MASSRKSKSSDLVERVAHALQSQTSPNQAPPGSSILVGLSGGVDSVVLLHLLREISPRHAWRISALHVHHGISLHADAWADFCRKLCQHYAIPLQVEHVDIAPLRDLGVEAAARKLRHAALARQAVDFIALAHHQDDQAETLLLQLLRGAGVRGASAMAAVHSRMKVPTLLRPLLDVPRADLLHYAQQQGLHWVEDESNADAAYPRNFLRHHILPQLEQRFPAYRDTLARSARHFAEASALMDALAEQDAGEAFDGETLNAGRLKQLDSARAKNLLRWFLRQRGAMAPDSAKLDEALRQLSTVDRDSNLCIEWGEWALQSYQGRAYVRCKLPQADPEWRMPWRGEEEMELPHLGGILRLRPTIGQGVSLQKLQAQPVFLHLRKGGERLRPETGRPARTLAYLFQKQGVPPWQRAYWPLLFSGETLAAVPGVATHCDFRSRPDEACVRLEWVR